MLVQCFGALHAVLMPCRRLVNVFFWDRGNLILKCECHFTFDCWHAEGDGHKFMNIGGFVFSRRQTW